MKKIIYFLIGMVLINLVGCGLIENTPTKQVEAFLSKYQTLDEEVLNDLGNVTERNPFFTEDQKKQYIDIMKKHYQDLRYEIKDEVIDGDNAMVIVEIEVTDYSKALEDTNKYFKENENDYIDASGTIDETKLNDYRLKKMEETKDTEKYTLELTLSKGEDDKWKMDSLTAVDEQKLNGTYIS